MTRHRFHFLCVLAAVVAARSATAVPPPPPTSLNNCQNAVKTATKQFVTNKVAAIGTCLQAVSTQIVKKNAGASGAAAACVTQFRRLNDSRALGKQLSDKLAAAIVKKCAPGGPNVTHTLADILGSGASVPQPLDAEDLNAWCTHFGGDGSIGSVQEWIDCLTASAECSVDAAVATQYPRALEWLALVKPSMQALTPPGTDLNKITDAVAGLDAVKAEIDGPDNNNVPNLQCGSSCGDGVKNGSESCDGSDLGGTTCTSLGYALGGTLSCASGCTYNIAGCVGQALPATGQTTSYVANDDGAVQPGATLSYTDNGDGTITDNNTKLMWEKKVKLDGTVDAANLHDADNCYPWRGLCAVDGAACGVNADCGANGPCNTGDCQASSPNGLTIFTWAAQLNAANFAGHNDWRAPSKKELESIVDAGTFSPAVSTAFNGASCGGACTNLTDPACSCTQSNNYWSSSTVAFDPSLAWVVVFSGGGVNSDGKTGNRYVRAVRGGL